MEEEKKVSSLKATHKELYGMLMLHNQRLDSVGTILIWLVLFGTLALCVSIHMRWLDSLFGVPNEQIRGAGVYSLICVAAFMLFGIVTGFREKIIYNSAKPDILHALRENNITVEALLADIADDENLKEVKERLLNDSNLQEPKRKHYG